MAEFVIIGGGVYGLATAWHLAREGADVVVLERKTIASGASGGPGRRGVRANFRDRRELPLMQAAYPIWDRLDEDLGTEGLFQRTGNLMLIGRDEDMPRARAQAWMQTGAGIETQVLDASDVRDLEPEAEETIAGGIFCPNDGLSDHTKTTRAYGEAARRAGVKIHERTEVRSIRYRSGTAKAVALADGTEVTASSGIVVLSNWSVAELLVGQVDMPVWSEAFQVLVSHPMDHVPVRHVVGHMNRTLSLKPEPGSRLMISGGYRGVYDRETHEGVALPESIEGNLADAIATYPGLEGITIETADAGHLESLSIDEVPIVDRLPGCPNLWFGTGWCGHGWAIAPIISELLAGFIRTSEAPNLLSPFTLDRFRAGDA